VTTPPDPPSPAAHGSGQRLESWKEIAAYLRRSERTVRRWEDKEGLPAHRHTHDKRGSVFAFSAELDAWRVSRAQLLDSDSGTEKVDEVATPHRPRRRLVLAAAVAGAVVAAGAWWALQPRAPAYTPDPEAVRLLQLANFSGNAGRTQVETGLRYIEEALRRDPGYSEVWAALATAHMVRVWFSETKPVEAFAQAKKEARRALELDSTSGAAWRVLAFISHYADWDQPAAETQFRRAIELRPTDAAALSWFGDYFVDLRQFDQARTYYRKAQEVAPRWLEPIAFTGNSYFFSGHAEMAVVEYRRVLASEPNFGLANHYLGRALVATGAHEEALTRLRKSNELLGDVPFSLADLGYALAVAGKRVEAETLRDGLVRRRDTGYYPAFAIATIEMGLGRTSSALDWLERAAEERQMGFYLPSVDPAYDPVRDDPRFVAIMRRMGLP
jgi:Tfp pilus assembly protein PilF